MWDQLEQLDKDIEKLRDRVTKAVTPVPASSRELLLAISQEITCTEDDLSERSANFYNGSGDTYLIYRFSVTVMCQPPALVPLQRRYTMDRFAYGYQTRQTLPVPFNGQIDFLWNYLVASRQSVYCRQPVGSSIFNGLERSQAFDLYEPLIIKPVDSIEFRLRPISYALPGSPNKTANTTYFVNFLAFGYRRPM